MALSIGIVGQSCPPSTLTICTCRTRPPRPPDERWVSYHEKLAKKVYERELELLQIEWIKLHA